MLVTTDYDTYSSWGDRCEEALKPDAELTHLVANMVGWDQIIVTPQGETPPGISDDINGKGMLRKGMGTAAFRRETERMFKNVNTSDVYTMCYWGVSQAVDMVGWQFTFGGTIDMGRFFDAWPIHVCMYELDTTLTSLDDQRHLESRKVYYLDFMLWSSKVMCWELPVRYRFLDAPVVYEEASIRAACRHTGKDAEAQLAIARARGSSQPIDVLPITPCARQGTVAHPGSRLLNGLSALMRVCTLRLSWVQRVACPTR